MRIIRPSYEIWTQSPDLKGIFKQIERAGRVCYKSEGNMTDTSADTFVGRLIERGHTAMLEHGTVYLKAPSRYLDARYSCNPYSKVFSDSEYDYITTNYRVIVENRWLDDLNYLCNTSIYHERRHTVRFICDRGVSHEFVRHRKFSFAQESTRFCNYSMDKFSNELTFIQPCWFEHDLCSEYCGHMDVLAKTPLSGYGKGEQNFLDHLIDTETLYLGLIGTGWKPQEARTILPNALKTELVMTGFKSDWERFFGLRAFDTAGTPHPQAKELAVPLFKEFKIRGYI